MALFTAKSPHFWLICGGKGIAVQLNTSFLYCCRYCLSPVHFGRMQLDCIAERKDAVKNKYISQLQIAWIA